MSKEGKNLFDIKCSRC